MRNECINRTLDGGCRRLYVSCPEFILDVTELGCGGVCCEFDVEDEEDEDKDDNEHEGDV